jgi:hypothetical protein
LHSFRQRKREEEEAAQKKAKPTAKGADAEPPAKKTRQAEEPVSFASTAEWCATPACL